MNSPEISMGRFMCPASLRSSDDFFFEFPDSEAGATQEYHSPFGALTPKFPPSWWKSEKIHNSWSGKRCFLFLQVFSGSFWSGFQIFFLGMEPAWCRRGTLHCFIATEDSYKVSHWKQYPPGTQYVYSNLSSGWRGFWKMMNFLLNGVGRTVFEVEWNQRRWNVRLQNLECSSFGNRHVQSGCL